MTHYPYSGMIPNLVIDKVGDNSFRSVRKAVCSVCRVTLDELISNDRHRRVSNGRHLLVYLLRGRCGVTLKECGELLGGRDHTTILNSQRVAENLLQTDPAFKSLLDQIEQQL